MRLRWIIVAGAVGLAIAWWLGSLIAAYVTAFGCMILYGLRLIILRLELFNPTESGDVERGRLECPKLTRTSHSDGIGFTFRSSLFWFSFLGRQSSPRSSLY
jgi:hypothetical protein